MTTQLWSWSIFVLIDLYTIVVGSLNFQTAFNGFSDAIFFYMFYAVVIAVSAGFAYEAHKERKKWDAAHADQAK